MWVCLLRVRVLVYGLLETDPDELAVAAERMSNAEAAALWQRRPSGMCGEAPIRPQKKSFFHPGVASMGSFPFFIQVLRPWGVSFFSSRFSPSQNLLTKMVMLGGSSGYRVWGFARSTWPLRPGFQRVRELRLRSAPAAKRGTQASCHVAIEWPSGACGWTGPLDLSASLQVRVPTAANWCLQRILFFIMVPTWEPMREPMRRSVDFVLCFCSVARSPGPSHRRASFVCARNPALETWT